MLKLKSEGLERWIRNVLKKGTTWMKAWKRECFPLKTIKNFAMAL